MTTHISVKINWFDFLEKLDEEELALTLHQNPQLLLKFTQEPLLGMLEEHHKLKLCIASRLSDESEWRAMLTSELDRFSRNRSRVFTFDKDEVTPGDLFKYYIIHSCYAEFDRDLSLKLDNNFVLCKEIICHMEKFGMKWRDLILEKHGLTIV